MATAGELKLRLTLDAKPATTDLRRLSFTITHLDHRRIDLRCATAGALWSLSHSIGQLASRIDDEPKRHKTERLTRSVVMTDDLEEPTPEATPEEPVAPVEPEEPAPTESDEEPEA